MAKKVVRHDDPDFKPAVNVGETFTPVAKERKSRAKKTATVAIRKQTDEGEIYLHPETGEEISREEHEKLKQASWLEAKEKAENEPSPMRPIRKAKTVTSTDEPPPEIEPLSAGQREAPTGEMAHPELLKAPALPVHEVLAHAISGHTEKHLPDHPNNVKTARHIQISALRHLSDPRLAEGDVENLKNAFHNVGYIHGYPVGEKLGEAAPCGEKGCRTICKGTSCQKHAGPDERPGLPPEEAGDYVQATIDKLGRYAVREAAKTIKPGYEIAGGRVRPEGVPLHLSPAQQAARTEASRRAAPAGGIVEGGRVRVSARTKSFKETSARLAAESAARPPIQLPAEGPRLGPVEQEKANVSGEMMRRSQEHVSHHTAALAKLARAENTGKSYTLANDYGAQAHLGPSVHGSTLIAPHSEEHRSLVSYHQRELDRHSAELAHHTSRHESWSRGQEPRVQMSFGERAIAAQASDSAAGARGQEPASPESASRDLSLVEGTTNKVVNSSRTSHLNTGMTDARS